MKRIGKFIGRTLAVLLVVGVTLWLVGPYEPAELTADFDQGLIEGRVDAYLAEQEARFTDITEGVEKRVIWAGPPGQKTDWAVLYVHGYSATSEEIRPVPDKVAEALGANLVYTRLTGHGRPGAAMAEATVENWMNDIAESLAIAGETGSQILVIATSTGATLMAAAAMDGDLMRQVSGLVMISPNFGINTPVEPLLTLPAARYWLPLLAGKDRSWEPHNEQQERYWSTSYPSVAVMPMAALVKAVDALDLGKATVPALFLYAETDKVVRAEKTAEMIAEWGGPKKAVIVSPGPDDDPSHHVIAGDILSPGQTQPAVDEILQWMEDNAWISAAR